MLLYQHMILATLIDNRGFLDLVFSIQPESSSSPTFANSCIKYPSRWSIFLHSNDIVQPAHPLIRCTMSMSLRRSQSQLQNRMLKSILQKTGLNLLCKCVERITIATGSDLFSDCSNESLQPLSQDYDLVSYTIHVVCFFFIQEWRDLQFKVDSVRWIFRKLIMVNRRGLVGSVLAYQTKSQDSSPWPDIKTKYEKYFLGDFISADFMKNF